MSNESEQDRFARDFVEQMFGKAPAHFPQGKLNADDQGELAVAFAVDLKSRTVIVRFPKPVDWIGLGKQDTLAWAAKLLELANRLP